MALRRNLRLRREYLYAKSLEGKERDMYDRKQKIKAALAGMWRGRPADLTIYAFVGVSLAGAASEPVIVYLAISMTRMHLQREKRSRRSSDRRQRP